MRRRFVTVALWSAVVLLAFIGFTASVARGFGVLQSRAFSEGPIPELSPIDRGSTLFMATLLGMDRETSAYRDIEDQNRRFLGKFNQYPSATLLHVVPAALFMILAPLQFSRSIRSRRIHWHRWSGRLIVAIAIPIGLSGLFFGLVMPFSGAVEASAIALFGGLFLFSLTRALMAILRRDVEHHREWMIRMFAIAIGVSVVRITGTVLAVLTREGPEAWFGQSVWIGFVITLALAELWIRRTRSLSGSAQGVAVPAVLGLASPPPTRVGIR